ncbi:uncharacterized protein A4U43_C02F5030 [Asparagus officinalis]|uniref:Uncharacterized protein n=1 Tax=Asparagus officinalis TaxID=4686 RepID=A0A5P1FKT0_ASPOF|nr:uncharacterized protein A4U43_C02F5030 [Asparagus officinalis]
MERTVSFQIGDSDNEMSLRPWMKNKQKSTNDMNVRNNSVRHGDAQLHLAVRMGNLAQVKDILTNFQTSRSKGSIWKKNSDGETALLIAAEIGHVEIVHKILKAANRQSVAPDVDNCCDAFHIAAKLGHAEVLKALLQDVPELIKTTDSSNATALYTAAAQDHVNIAQLLLDADDSVASIARNNGKTPLHIASRRGHLEVVRMLLEKDPSLVLKTDKKGQTALHMAAKGQNVMIVREFRNRVSSVIRIVDNKQNTALHTATRKGRSQIVRVVLSFPGIDVNALNKTGETALNVAEKYFNEEIASILREEDINVTKNDQVHPAPSRSPNQLKQAVKFIKQGVQFQLKRSQRTQHQVQELKKKVEKMKCSGLNNAVNSVNVVATLIASVAFAAIFQRASERGSAGGDWRAARSGDRGQRARQRAIVGICGEASSDGEVWRRGEVSGDGDRGGRAPPPSTPDSLFELLMAISPTPSLDNLFENQSVSLQRTNLSENFSEETDLNRGGNNEKAAQTTSKDLAISLEIIPLNICSNASTREELSVGVEGGARSSNICSNASTREELSVGVEGGARSSMREKHGGGARRRGQRRQRGSSERREELVVDEGGAQRRRRGRSSIFDDGGARGRSSASGSASKSTAGEFYDEGGARRRQQEELGHQRGDVKLGIWV